ncbi:hypothetical protein V8D89_016251, partial [Ganoderma adspersum]
LQTHTKGCWGLETVTMAGQAISVKVVHEEIIGSILRTGSITAHFERKGGQITYCTRQLRLNIGPDHHTHSETCVKIVKWVCESLCAFHIVDNPGFKVLIKTRCPGYYPPSLSTVALNMREVFKCSCSQITKMLQDHDSVLHFAIHAWTSPNYYAFVMITVHFEIQGKPMSFLLDIIEVACSHTSVNLAAVFTNVLKEFSIKHKVSLYRT